MRHAVVVAVELDVVVDVDAGALEARDRPCAWPAAAAAPARSRASKALARQPGSFLNGALVQIDQQLGDRRVELGQAEEAPVAQAREDPALDDLHPDFDLGLVARMRRARRQHRHVVVVAELLDQAVHDRLVAVGAGDQRARLVGHDQPRHAADELQRVDDRADPVGAVCVAVAQA